MLENLLIISLFGYFLALLKDVLFWCYFWQLKEYRLDRFLEHFHTKSGKKLVFNKKYLLLVILTIFGGFIAFHSDTSELLLFQSAAQGQGIGLQASLFTFFFSLFYLGVGVLFLKSFFKKRILAPTKTLKARLLVFFSSFFVFYAALSVYLFPLSLFWLVLLHLLVGDIVSLAVVIVNLFAWPVKYRLIKKAKNKRLQFKDLIVIGITGSYGKSSVKEFLATILSEKYKVLKTPHNYNTELGVSSTILASLDKEHEIFVCEMGAYKKGEIKALCDIAKPNIGILTAIGNQHLALFGSKQNIVEGKFELIESLPNKGLGILNGDNSFIQKNWKKGNCRKSVVLANKEDFKLEKNCLLKGENVLIKNFKLSFEVEGETIKTNLLGKHNVTNLLLAISASLELGLDWESIQNGISKIQAPEGTLNVLSGPNNSIILDDSYNASTDGFLAALKLLKEGKNQKIVAFSKIHELGKAAKEDHYKIGQIIGEYGTKLILLSEDYAEEIINGAVESGMNKESIVIEINRLKVKQFLEESLGKDDICLLEGRETQSILSA